MNKNEILQVCLKDLALLRARAENIAYLNNLRAKKSEEFIEIDKKERDLVFKIGKNKAFNIVDNDLESHLEKIRDQKKDVLFSIGLSVDDLSPKYSCPFCDDTGYIKTKMCSCLKFKIHSQILKQTNAEKTNLSSFKTFNENVATSEEHKNTLLKIKIRFEQIAKNYNIEHPNFIVLSGKTGVGKTFLTECLATDIIDKGNIVSFISAFGMNNMFASYHTTFDDTKATFLNTLLDPDVLVIDDLGTEPILRNITKEYLYLILSERSRLNRMTVITTNLDPLELMNRYNERIFSRLFNKRESFVTQIKGNDMRIKK